MSEFHLVLEVRPALQKTHLVNLETVQRRSLNMDRKLRRLRSRESGQDLGPSTCPRPHPESLVAQVLQVRLQS